MGARERLERRAGYSFDTGVRRAREMGSQFFTSKHLMLGLIIEEKPLIKKLLTPFDVEVDAFEKVITNNCETGSGSPATLKGTEGLKASLTRAMARADSKQKNEIESSVLLASIIECDAGIDDLLEGFQIDPIKLSEDALKEAGMELGDLSSVTPIESSVPTDTTTNAPPTNGTPTTTSTTAPKPKTTPNLDKFGRDITKLANEGKLPVILGRSREIQAVLETLCRPQKNNPMLLGEPGVGKTAIVEGIAQKIAKNETPPMLQGKRVIELSLTSLLAGAGVVGELETRLQNVLKEVRDSGNVILFIDEIHALMGMGGVKGQVDPATMLKPALARGEIHLIGATTYAEYRKYIEEDEALARRFAPIMIDEPPRETTMAILKKIMEKYEKHFDIVIPSDLLPECYELAQDFLRSRFFPDKAIDLLERASSRAMIEGPAEGEEKPVLNNADFLSVLSDMTGLPLDRLTLAKVEGRKDLKEFLLSRLPGQEDVVNSIESVLRLSKMRLDLSPKRPDGVFLAVGPTGCGKESLAEALAAYFFDDETKVIKFDMGEFQESHSISRLIGSPPGYIGSDQEGQLTRPVANKPFSVVQFSNIERANLSVLELLQQVFDEGRLTDAQGRTVFFSDATIVMTSDLNTASSSEKTLGFVTSTEKEVKRTLAPEQVTEKLKDKMPPEFIACIDNVLIFSPLNEDAILSSLESTMNVALERIHRMGFKIEIKTNVYQYLLESKQKATSSGDKTLRRIIEREILTPLAAEIEKCDKDRRHIEVTLENGKIVCHTSKLTIETDSSSTECPPTSEVIHVLDGESTETDAKPDEESNETD